MVGFERAMEDRLLTPKQKLVLDEIQDNYIKELELLKRQQKLLKEFRQLRLIEPLNKRLGANK